MNKIVTLLLLICSHLFFAAEQVEMSLDEFLNLPFSKAKNNFATLQNKEAMLANLTRTSSQWPYTKYFNKDMMTTLFQNTDENMRIANVDNGDGFWLSEKNVSNILMKQLIIIHKIGFDYLSKQELIYLTSLSDPIQKKLKEYCVYKGDFNRRIVISYREKLTPSCFTKNIFSETTAFLLGSIAYMYLITFKYPRLGFTKS